MKKNKTDKILKDFDLPEIIKDVNDVRKVAFEAVRKYYAREMTAILTLLLFMVGITVILTVKTNLDVINFGLSAIGLVIFFAVYEYVGAVYEYLKVYNRIKTAFLKQFAKANGLSFSKHGQWEGETGSLFGRNYDEKKKGFSQETTFSFYIYDRKAFNFIKGEFMGRPMRLFEYGFSVGGGPQISAIYRTTVFCLELEANLPHMYLDAYGENDEKAHKWQTSGLKNISLESNEFDSQYRLFITEGQHLPALQIFTPDIMANLLDLPSEYRFDIEFTGNRLYIYEPI